MLEMKSRRVLGEGKGGERKGDLKGVGIPPLGQDIFCEANSSIKLLRKLFTGGLGHWQNGSVVFCRLRPLFTEVSTRGVAQRTKLGWNGRFVWWFK